ncbi:ClC family H(+)/Cl(-) exchange transporter [Clostridium ragsdalei]|nr:ClC family H(+)/Cl(-) exchange transporter [Clostridium ragsdalei]
MKNQMEMSDKRNKYEALFNENSFKLKRILESIIVGMLTGVIISFLRFLVDKSGYLLANTYKTISLKHWLIPIWIIFLIIIGYIIGLIAKKNAAIRGSGIPQVEGVLLEKLDMTWWKVILGKFVGSFLAIGTGLSLGIEGPSVQLGAAVGQGFSKILKKIKIEEKYLIISGTSAGIAAAFNAPLAGTMFALEEISKKLSPTILISAFSAAAASNFISYQLFGFKPVFDFRNVPRLPLNCYLFIIVFGIIIGVLGVVFNKALVKTQNIFSMQKWIPIQFRPMFCLGISIFIGFLLPQILGEGNMLIMSLAKGNIAIKMLVILLVCKFIFSMICCGSGTPGGIFLPLFTVGALIGAIYGSAATYLFHINSSYIGIFIILAMAGYFSSVIRAPMSGSILVIEMTGSFSNLLPIAIISVVSYLTAYILKSKPIYETLLEKLLIN